MVDNFRMFTDLRFAFVSFFICSRNNPICVREFNSFRWELKIHHILLFFEHLPSFFSFSCLHHESPLVIVFPLLPSIFCGGLLGFQRKWNPVLIDIRLSLINSCRQHFISRWWAGWSSVVVLVRWYVRPRNKDKYLTSSSACVYLFSW